VKTRLSGPKIKFICSSLCYYLLFFLTLPTVNISQLAGQYTIGSGGDYSSFSEAVDSLHSLGINEPVTFKVLSGEYNEHFIINHVAGTGEINTSTYRTDAGNTVGVMVYYHAEEDEFN